ncbi:MAG: transcriptional regulator [Kaistella sp.]|nr:transcriptional regulator [Kaistella sp.]
MQEGRIVEIIISELDLFVIDIVRELRGRAKPYVSQVELSQRMGFADGFVGKVENFNSNARYNIRKLNLVARALSLESPKKLQPDKTLPNDLVSLKLRVNRKKNDTVEFDDNNQVIKNYEILEKRVLTEDEVKLHNNRRAKKS